MPFASGYSIPSGNTNVPDVITLGSRSIHSLLNDLTPPNEIPNEFYFDCDMGHGLDEHCNIEACEFDCNFEECEDDENEQCYENCPDCYDPCATYPTEFGTNLKTRAEVARYIVERCAVFFQTVINGQGNDIGKNVFVNCENERHDDGNCNTDNITDDYEGNCLELDCSTPEE